MDNQPVVGSTPRDRRTGDVVARMFPCWSQSHVSTASNDAKCKISKPVFYARHESFTASLDLLPEAGRAPGSGTALEG